jgi:hypothetical protein
MQYGEALAKANTIFAAYVRENPILREGLDNFNTPFHSSDGINFEIGKIGYVPKQGIDTSEIQKLLKLAPFPVQLWSFETGKYC